MSHSRLFAILGLALLCVRRADAQTLQLEAITRASPEVEVFGDGNVKGTVGQADNATAAAGSLGMRYNDGTFVVTGSINIAGTHSTVIKSPGASLLSPATGGPLNAGLIDLRLPHLLSISTCRAGNLSAWRSALCTFGLHVYGSAATSRWATRLGEDGAVIDSVDVPYWGFGIGPSVTFFSGTIKTGTTDKAVSMVLDAGFVSRHLRGDLFSQDTLRTRLLTTGKKDFYGLELGLGLQFGNVRSGFSYYFLNGDVPGLSHGQVVAGVSIQASLLGGPVNETGVEDNSSGDNNAGNGDANTEGNEDGNGEDDAGPPPNQPQ
jgi:hypothetical protein